MQNFWQTLPQPFLVLAPMEDVTDTVFRQIIASCGKPDVFFTEFANTDGLCSKGYDSVAKRLKFSEKEHPLVAQIWGNNPVHYQTVAKMLIDMKFDGIDINMGCPEKSVVSKGCCIGLIKNPQLAKEIIQATKEATGDLPISVKTRIGFDTIQTEEWLGFLLEQDLAALTVHGRTKKEMSDVPAHWDEIAKVVKLRDKMDKQTVIIGNGDITSLQDAMEKNKTYGVDGVMVGRGIFHNPWLFNKIIKPETITAKQKLTLLIDHLTLFDQTWNKTKNFDIMKKFYKMYTTGMANASELRIKLMTFDNAQDTITFLKSNE